MQYNVKTQHKYMYSFYIGSLCNVAFLMSCFACIVTSQVFVKSWMQWSIALSFAFYRGRENIYELSSALILSMQFHLLTYPHNPSHCNLVCFWSNSTWYIYIMCVLICLAWIYMSYLLFYSLSSGRLCLVLFLASFPSEGLSCVSFWFVGSSKGMEIATGAWHTGTQIPM